MGFYGNIKRSQTNPWTFDRYFPNRKAMDDETNNDNVYVGRYVLVNYCCVPNENENEGYTPDFINRFESQETEAIYNSHRDTDSNFYHDTYDNTVWQKIYTNVGNDNSFKYILIARLNAAAPNIELNPISPKYLTDNTTEEWNQPSVSENSSNDTYIINMPTVMELDVGNIDSDFYASDLITNIQYKPTITDDQGNPLTREDMLSAAYNQITWKNYQKNGDNNYVPSHIDTSDSSNSTPNIDKKELEIKLYAFGQMMSDLYDIMYGAPDETGVRPFYVDNLSSLLSNYDKGLVGILTSIATEQKGDAAQDSAGRHYQSGLYYYFNSRWADAQESPDNFIENIPRVVGSSNEFINGKAHYKINFATSELIANRNSTPINNDSAETDNDIESPINNGGSMNNGGSASSGTVVIPGYDPTIPINNPTV